MKAGESLVIKLHFNVLKKNPEPCYQPYTTICYDFFVYNIDKDDKIDFIEKFIQKHEQVVIDTVVTYMPDGKLYDIASNTEIKTKIKSMLPQAMAV